MTSRACASPTCPTSRQSASSRKSTIFAEQPRRRCATPAPAWRRLRSTSPTHEDRAAERPNWLPASRLSDGGTRGEGGDRRRWTPEQPAERIGIAFEAGARIGAKHSYQCLTRIVVQPGVASTLFPVLDRFRLGLNRFLQCLPKCLGDLDLTERRRADEFVNGDLIADAR